MIWLTWRQHRTAACIFAVMLVILMVVIITTGLSITDFAKNIGNTTCATSRCMKAYTNMQNYVMNDAFGSLPFFVIFQCALLAFPVCIGLFVGVPIVTHELEQGTFRLLWTQSISWRRWLLSTVGSITVSTLAVTMIMTGLFLWWKVPVLATLSLPAGNMYNPGLTATMFGQWGYFNYDVWSIPIIAYTLFALFLGICLGTILKKTIPAIGVTLVLFVLVRILVEIYWRPYFLPPMTFTVPITSIQTPAASVWTIASYEIDKNGNRVSQIAKHDPQSGITQYYPDICSETYSAIQNDQIGEKSIYASNITQNKAYLQCIAMHGFKRIYVYQPVDRVFLFQEIESGIYLLLSALLLVITLWWTKHRIIGVAK